MRTVSRAIRVAVAGALMPLVAFPAVCLAQAASERSPAARAETAATKEVTPPEGYVIGPGDVLSVVFWKEDDLSADVVVRPDGKITLPLINEITAAGITPEELRVNITKAAENLVQSPTVMVRVKEIKSRYVSVTGMIARPGQYPLDGPMRVMQLISLAGGLVEWADKGNVRILRQVGDQQMAYRFNYDDVSKGKNLQQNIELKPGDVVVAN